MELSSSLHGGRVCPLGVHNLTVELPVSTMVMMPHCVECKDEIFGAEKCAECTECKKKLHEECNNKTKHLEDHPFYPYVKFKFSNSNGNLHECSACFQLIKGCHYFGGNRQDTKSYIYIHPFCFVKLRPESISTTNISHHQEKLKELLEERVRGSVSQSFDIRKDLVKKCICCNTLKSTNYGWVYNYIFECKGQNKIEIECHVGCLRNLLTQASWQKISKRRTANHPYDQNYFKSEKSGRTPWLYKLAVFLVSAIVVGFDLIISAFVGSPILSTLLPIIFEILGSQLKNFIKGYDNATSAR